MRDIIIKMILLGVILFIIKSHALGQNTDIKCEISSFDLSLSGSKALSEFGSFLVFAEGKEMEKEGAIMIAKYYEFLQTSLILSVLVIYAPEDELSSSPQLMIQMGLSKRRFPVSSSEIDKFFNEITKHAVNHMQVGYPIEAFEKGGEGRLGMMFIGKKPVQIMMTCKKIGK